MNLRSDSFPPFCPACGSGPPAKGCHLCDGASEKIAACISAASWDPSLPNLARASLEVRDVASRPEWAAAYDLEVPVLKRAGPTNGEEVTLPRPQPRASAQQLGVRLEAQLAQFVAGGAAADTYPPPG